jgi:hypothetical protein
MSKHPLLTILVFLVVSINPELVSHAQRSTNPNYATSATAISGLIGLWHLDGNMTDASGFGHNGTAVGTVTSTTGRFSSAYHFDGSSAINCGNVDLNSTGEFSVSAWVKSTDPYTTEVWRMAVSKLDPSGGGPLELFLGDGRPTPNPGSAGNYLAWNGGIGLYNTFSPYDLTKNAKDGSWHHLAVTFKSGSQIVYFDGVSVGSTAATDPLPNTSSNFRIGGIDFGPYHHPWIGEIDEVAAYNRALSAAEIQTLSQGVNPGGGGGTSDSTSWTLTGNSNAKTSSILGTTNAIPLRLFTNNAVRAFISTTGNFGIGTVSPQQRLHIEGTSNQAIAVNTSALSTTSGSGMVGYAKALPTVAGQRIGYFSVGSRGGAENNYIAAGMSGFSGGAWTAGSSYPAYLTFETTPSGSAVRTERMRITAPGNVGIGTTVPNASALVDLTSTTRGLLIPRLSKTQRNAIVSPARGLLIFQTDSLPGFYYFDGGWKQIAASSSAASAALSTTESTVTLQELKDENVKLKEELAELKQTFAEFKNERSVQRDNFSASSAHLEQNAPNPFNHSTQIRYNLPSTFNSAQLVITDNTGREVKRINLAKGQNGIMNIQAGTLSSGVYNYSLVVDNSVVETKKMILTK